MKYEKIDIANAPVLSQGDAIGFLKYLYGEFINHVLTEYGDPDVLDYDLKDISGMLATIIKDDWEYVKFVECPMSSVGISIIKMEEAKND